MNDTYLVSIIEKTLPRLTGLSGLQALEVFKASGLSVDIALPAIDRIYVDRGNLRLYLSEKKLFWKTQAVVLTPMEFRVVNFLSLQPEITWSYRDIYDVITGHPGMVAGADGKGHSINVRSNIKRIRAKFLEVDHDFLAVKSLRKFGYYWKE